MTHHTTPQHNTTHTTIKEKRKETFKRRRFVKLKQKEIDIV